MSEKGDLYYRTSASLHENKSWGVPLRSGVKKLLHFSGLECYYISSANNLMYWKGGYSSKKNLCIMKDVQDATCLARNVYVLSKGIVYHGWMYNPSTLRKSLHAIIRDIPATITVVHSREHRMEMAPVIILQLC